VITAQLFKIHYEFSSFYPVLGLFWSLPLSGPDPKHWLTGRLIRLHIGVADPDQGTFLTLGSGKGKKSGSGFGIRDGLKIRISIRNPVLGWTTQIIILEAKNHFFGLKYRVLKFFDADQGSGMEKKIASGFRGKHPGSATLFYLVFGQDHRVHIFTRDETVLVCPPTQLERTRNFTGDGKCSERGWACTSHLLISPG
jgi:hypothetical protein